MRGWCRRSGAVDGVVTDSAAGQPITLSDAALRRVLVTLCLTQIISWGGFYYAFTVLSVRITEQSGLVATGGHRGVLRSASRLRPW